MHRECMEFMSQLRTRDAISIIEIGSRDVNGTPRGLFPNADYIGLDVRPGPCVDMVVDGGQYSPEHTVDMVICTEVLEHTQNWRELIQHAASWLKYGGILLVTCAGPGREPHSAVDGEHRLLHGEHYDNVSPEDLAATAVESGLSVRLCQLVGTDTQMYAVKPVAQ